MLEEGEKSYDGVRLEELLTTCDWSIEEDPTMDYSAYQRTESLCGDDVEGTRRSREVDRTASQSEEDLVHEERFLRASGNGIRGLSNCGDVFLRVFRTFSEHGERSEGRTKQEAKSSLAAWAAFGPLKEATDQLADPELRVHLFDSTVLPALCYAAETWPNTVATSKTLRTTHRALERRLLKFNRRTQHLVDFAVRI
ncbi:unnamed protein product [Strongylus vulgaris]|uniref:Uncharacterized protein n=1 Tax=Strongylus vulgaris TaxID=40348 RepID=A0A3P7IMA4_STRVU|nr:unnamed protein product [Strongylus vulgaris]